MIVPALNPCSRLMIFAPHPDDEALACSIILQHAVRAAAAIRVVYATDGENNPWPQRVLECKWRLNGPDRGRWGKLRRVEALGALQVLGVHPSDACFLGLPDQGLTDLLVTDCRSSLERLATAINNWSPTDLLVPSIADTHPDHSALAVMLRLVLAQSFPNEPQMSVWSYAVHGESAAFRDRAQELRQSKRKTAVKERAIRCHKTQLKLSRRRFLAYAARPERFLKLRSRESTPANRPFLEISRGPHILRLKLLLSTKPIGIGQPALFVLGHSAAGRLRCVRMQLPLQSSTVEMFDCLTHERLCVARYRGNAFGGEFAMPLDIFSSAHALFVKLEDRSWFFDKAGWFETSPTARSEHIRVEERNLRTAQSRQTDRKELAMISTIRAAVDATCSSPTTSRMQRPKVDGKFLMVGAEKFFVKGATYGSFPPNAMGDQFPEADDVARDFALMRKGAINTILTYTVPPITLLDQAEQFGLRAIVVVPWMEYVCFLEEKGVRKKVIRKIRDGVASCRRHPAVLMYCVGKEIPPDIVRYHGPKKVQAFLEDLYHAAKDEDPESLITYTNFPTTEYLELPFVDVSTFNVYLHNRSELCAYLSRLQHLSGETPLVLTELGMCSFRNGREAQAAFLDWQIEEAFDHGVAGAVVFGWTDPFYQDETLVEDWGFGLVDANRQPKPSYQVVQRRFTTSVPFSPERRWPKVSVVVAAHNAAQTLEDCLSSLEKLRYPDYEVIVVNDGSRDATEAIAGRFPVRCICTPNQGVSAARNVGMRAATGEIVAYLDSDARADPDWLHYLAVTFMKSDVAGVGGPNIIPPEDDWVAQCVYRSPGGPTQVMLNDQHAEHIPGCNMSFRRSALEDIGGFDPRFRMAADDVDICWRLMDAGYQIGFSPSAVVWHHRRPSVKAYWRQQVGYGISESILEWKSPNKFNPWGHTLWAGRIYAPYPFFLGATQPLIYHGIWGSAPFQPMYDRGTKNLFAVLPRAMEWHAILILLAFLSIFSLWAFAMFAVGFAYTIGYCVSCSWHAKIDRLVAAEGSPTFLRRLRSRALIAYLHFLEPIARDWGRLKGGLTFWRSVSLELSHKRRVSRWWQRLQPFRRVVRWSIPGTMALEKNAFLSRLLRRLTRPGCAVRCNAIFDDWDLKLRRGVMGTAWVRMVVEHHGGPKRLARLSIVMALPRPLYWVFGVIAALALVMERLGGIVSAVVVAMGFLVFWIGGIAEANRLEASIVTAAANAARELETERHVTSSAFSEDHDIEAPRAREKPSVAE
jgi:GT2 family glycosyltransferase/LmbE family N-acetylglucosaminyl deacetylase